MAGRCSALSGYPVKPSAQLPAKQQATPCTFRTSLQPLAATKASTDSRRQPLSGLLSSLEVTGVAAGVVAANLEEVPLTGRRQLQIKWLQPKTRKPGMMPVVDTLTTVCNDTTWDQGKQLSKQGVTLMLRLYNEAALGAALLADRHHGLKARLSTLPQTAKLQYCAHQLDPSAGFSEGHSSDKAWYNFWYHLKAKRRLFSLCQLVNCFSTTHATAWCGSWGMKLATDRLDIFLRRTAGLWSPLVPSSADWQ